MTERQLCWRTDGSPMSDRGAVFSAGGSSSCGCSIQSTRQRGWLLVVKRTLDLSVALAGLAFLFPIVLLLSAWVWVSMGKPIFFRQKRPGRDARAFILFKFTTMSRACDAAGQLLPDDIRLTRSGRLLRSQSLDEMVGSR